MPSKYTVVLVVASASVVTSFAIYYLRKKWKHVVWEAVGTVESLYIYPLKSGRAIEVNGANCTEYGLQLNTFNQLHVRDRCLVVYKEETRAFQTARNYKQILLIETFINKDGFILTAPNQNHLIIKIPSLKNSYQDEIIMWNGEKVFTLDCGDEAAKWVSRYLLKEDHGLRLGYHDGIHKRDINKYHQSYIEVHPKLKNATSGMYSDLSSVLLMNKSSVDDLASKIPNSRVSVRNFRPNIVVQGVPPYAEDDWEKIKIGETVLKTVMPCSRCSVTTIEPDTATWTDNYEPIKTLKTYRTSTQYQSGHSFPNFGLYMGLENVGEIRVGDVVYVPKK
ncbi:hypothetical protein FQR65_LT07538 [Abscondita terminalis]|nr:hypothetical protein FQR65_LT07538 [Abscondita terminalis]